MNKNTKTAGVAITTLGLLFSLYMAFSIGKDPLVFSNDSDNQYVLNLGNEKNRSNIAKAISKSPNIDGAPADNQTGFFDAVTQEGNVVKFGYSNINFSPDYNPSANMRSWGTFRPNSTLYNVTPINGMSSVEISFSDTNSLSLAYGWIDDVSGEITYEVDAIALTPDNSTFNFYQDGPEVLKIYNTSANPVALADIVINYSCYNTINPYCVPTDGDFTYDFVPTNEEYVITGYEGNDVDVVLPSKIYDGVNSAYVREIADEAFKNYYLESVTMPNTITTIGDDAFNNCSSLETINFSSNLTEIGENAFYACGQLTTVNIPNSVSYIGEGAFSSCYLLTSISLPNNLQNIADETFKNCQSLTNISIPDNVSSLGSNAFQNCYNLTSIELSDNLETIGDSTFENCQNLSSIALPNSVTTIGDGAFRYCYNLSSATLSNNLISIGNSAFQSCQNLSSIVLPNSLTSIGDNAFRGCGALTKIDIPNNVVSIGKNAFDNCWNLSTVIIPTSLQTVSSNSFNNIVWNAKLFYEGSSLPNSIKNSFNSIISKVYFYSATANNDGRHWRYVSGEPVIWQKNHPKKEWLSTLKGGKRWNR